MKIKKRSKKRSKRRVERRKRVGGGERKEDEKNKKRQRVSLFFEYRLWILPSTGREIKLSETKG